MTLKSQIETLKEELELLKREGEESIYLSDASREILSRWQELTASEAAPAKPMAKVDPAASRQNLGLEPTPHRVEEAPKKVARQEEASTLPSPPDRKSVV